MGLRPGLSDREGARQERPRIQAALSDVRDLSRADRRQVVVPYIHLRRRRPDLQERPVGSLPHEDKVHRLRAAQRPRDRSRRGHARRGRRETALEARGNAAEEALRQLKQRGRARVSNASAARARKERSPRPQAAGYVPSLASRANDKIFSSGFVYTSGSSYSSSLVFLSTFV